MRKCLKIILCIILIIFCFSNFLCVVNARDPDDPNGPSGVQEYKPSFTPDSLTGTGGETTDIILMGSNILKVLGIISSAISIIAMIALGIKYMVGSIEEKAQYKKTLVPYFLGALFVFGATTITGAIYAMFK